MKQITYTMELQSCTDKEYYFFFRNNSHPGGITEIAGKLEILRFHL